MLVITLGNCVLLNVVNIIYDGIPKGDDDMYDDEGVGIWWSLLLSLV